jgi:hypothetical protein
MIPHFTLKLGIWLGKKSQMKKYSARLNWLKRTWAFSFKLTTDNFMNSLHYPNKSSSVIRPLESNWRGAFCVTMDMLAGFLKVKGWWYALE